MIYDHKDFLYVGGRSCGDSGLHTHEVYVHQVHWLGGGRDVDQWRLGVPSLKHSAMHTSLQHQSYLGMQTRP